MIEKKLTFVCVQPSIPYYAWQIDVMLHNFYSLGIHENYKIHCLFGYNTKEKDWQEKVDLIHRLSESYEGIADFFFYEDTRKTPVKYIPSIRPNILKQHFEKNPRLNQDVIFYHDCDIVFTKYPTFIEKYMDGDDWYLSNTVSYIGYEYIKTKGEGIIEKMCEIVGIDEEIVRINQNNSGGAQYIMKNVDSEFFEKVEKDCELMYETISKISLEKKNKNPNYHELQIWCADMWCVLWGAWLRGYKTLITKDMDFCWATDFIGKWDDTYIYHNAGATASDRDKLFYKGDYMKKYPYQEDFSNISKERCSSNYVDLIIKAGNNTCLV